MTKLNIFYFNYPSPCLPLKLDWAHDLPFEPKTEPTTPECLDRGSEHSCLVHKPLELKPSLTWRRGSLAFGD